MTIGAALLPGDRLHLNHGPIDLIIGADGAREEAFAAARARFETVLTELMAELPLLQSPVGKRPSGGIARRMYAAAEPFADGLTTPMIAVAGAVAETVLQAMTEAADLSRAYVNNGGDIAFHLSGNDRFKIAVAAPDGRELGQVDIGAEDDVRGICTSGQKGRSLSLGIADAVTVLARSAAMADAAATQIANAVDLPGHPAIARVSAQELRDESDLGAALVVHHVGDLTAAEIRCALEGGQTRARYLQKQQLIDAAALFLRGDAAFVGLPDMTHFPQEEPEPCLML